MTSSSHPADPAAAAPESPAEPLQVDLVDGTYELFRHYYAPGAPRGKPGDRAAVRGVLGTVLAMLEGGARHLAVATDHVIESFRNRLWPGYKTGDGIDPALLDQFHPLEDALAAMGVAVWRMTDFEADDGLAAGAAMAAADPRVAQVRIWTPDKDLAQCVAGRRVVQVDRRSGAVRDEDGVVAKFGVPPAAIPDWLALVGDSADGYPGIPGIGPKTAASLVSRYGPIEEFPAETLGSNRDDALLFKTLATLRTDAPLFADVDELRWRGPAAEFPACVERWGDARLLARCSKAAETTGDR